MYDHHPHLIIMAGGGGCRLWPRSSEDVPKQFQDLLGQGTTLLQATTERFKAVIPPANVWVVTQEKYRQTVINQLPWINTQQVLCEPISRNTATCIAYTCHKIATSNASPNLSTYLVVTPADHAIQHPSLLIKAIEQALAGAASTGQLVLLGTPCKRPATGYGYISFEQTLDPVKPVIQFVEKPLLQEAILYTKQSNYAWNTGILLGSLSAFIKNYQQHLPHIWSAFQAGKQLLYANREKDFLTKIYPQLPDISFDHGILEKAAGLYTVVCEFGWSDLGTWSALYEYLPKQELGNTIRGEVVTWATKNCLIQNNRDTLIATYGVEDLVIVQDDDGILICPRTEAEHLKALIKHIATARDKP